MSQDFETTRSQIEESIEIYFKKKFKHGFENGLPVIEIYKIVAKPKQIDLDSPEVQRLLMRVTAVHMAGRVGKYINLTQLFNPVFLLCKYCHEDVFIEVLNKLWAKGTIGISIPDLERKVSRGGKPPIINGKRISFDMVNYSFKQIEQKLDIIFFEVCTKNNIKIPFDISESLSKLGRMDEL